ncbi:hypothetical protein SAMN05421752_11531 [Natronorubrum thiooxidans]|uniref:Uncharacterized protein n=1 Tax=Natronorubrum thiooxidans TaxID=308853 RepID=A0A1N7GT33_9EURY|nr:hypothetical protein SAMN05421752_11531 [Natronorubrum thiooxidans]
MVFLCNVVVVWSMWAIITAFATENPLHNFGISIVLSDLKDIVSGIWLNWRR